MAYRRIPRTFDEKEILSDIGTRLRYGDVKAGSVKAIAERMGRSYENLLDILNGRYDGPLLDILHAAVIETDGDPEIKKYLEPEGYVLVRDESCVSASKCPEQEIADVILAASDTIQKLRSFLKDGIYSKRERVAMLLSIDKIEKEVAEARAAVKNITMGDS